MDNSHNAEAASSDPDISSDDDKTVLATPRTQINTALTSSTPQSACTEVWHELEVEVLTPSDSTPRYDCESEASKVRVAAQPSGETTAARCANRSSQPVNHDVDDLPQPNSDSPGALVTPAQGVDANRQTLLKRSPVNSMTPSTVASTVATPCFSECSDIVDLTQT